MCNRQLFPLVAALLLMSSTAHSLKDPTRPSVYRAAATQQSLKLESILLADNRKVAVINGQVLTVGERLGNVKIVDIRKGQVTINRNGYSSKLELTTDSIRQEK